MLRIKLTIFLTITAHYVFSQSDIQERYERRKIFSAYEVVIGGGVLKNSGYQSQYLVPKFGYSIGVGAYHTFSNSFEFNVRFTYDLKGSKAVEKSGPLPGGPFPNPYTSSYTIDANFHYFTLTALPTFKVGVKKNVVLGAGYFYSILKSADIKERDVLSNGQVMTKATDEVYDGKTDMGICAFAGYRFKMKKSRTGTIQLFYNHSIQDVDDPISGWQRNKSIMLMFSVSLPSL